jgi:hypothetical protein
MSIKTRFDVEGTEYNDNNGIEVVSATGENNSSSTFSVDFDNYIGRNVSNFSVGNEVTIYADDNESPTTKIFSGIIETINMIGQDNNEGMNLRGRDFTQRLMDTIVEPQVFNDTEVSEIVTSIVADVPDITTNNVDVTSTTLSRISFNNISTFDALKQLAELSGFIFYVDVDKDLHFEAKSSISSGVTLDTTNILNMTTEDTDDGLFNEVTVYGDRVFTGVVESFTANGGSVYNLEFKPHNTEVFVGGSTTPKRGGVFELVGFNPSGVEYLVAYNDQNIVFVSGTDAGDNIPTSGTDSFTVNYDRTTPIIKLARDTSSQTQYGLKQKVIVDKTINDPDQAADFAKTFLNSNKGIVKEMTARLNRVINLTAGNTVMVNYPYHNINSSYQILEVKYDLKPNSNFMESHISVKLNKKKPDFIDTLKKQINAIEALQSSDVEEGDFLSRLEFATGSVGQKVKSWTVSTTSIGSDWYLGSPAVENGFIGSPGSYWIGSHTVTYVVQGSGGE